ncbi:MAG TPA: xanthine dehydrogenase family protein subunit M [Acidocella sp.]|nr:MAG: carbon monoxide dehydrogenase [Rhodospirillales bacterium 20-64-7]HQT46767.1 xanthine dehydrogenase family protein subunit M [Acidocella sp.]
MYDFNYVKPRTLTEASQLLADDFEAKALAGGMTFIPVLKQRLNKPSVVVDLAGLGLAGIRQDGEHVVIGAMTTHGEIAASEMVRRAVPGLAELAGNIGDRQVRFRGTLGGSLANNDPSACYPAAVLALDAMIQTNHRSISPAEFFLGMFATALEPGELITEVRFPRVERAAYAKFANPASHYAMVGVFAAKTAAGARVAVTGAGQSGVFRHAAMEQALDKNFTPEALDHVETPLDLMNGDIHGSAGYRAHLVGVMAKRAVAAALG